VASRGIGFATFFATRDPSIQLGSGVLHILEAHDVVALQHGARFVAEDQHCLRLRESVVGSTTARISFLASVVGI